MEYPKHYTPLYRKFHPSFVKAIMSDFSNYQSVMLNERLFADIKFLGDMTTTETVETGAFIIKTGVGFGTNRYAVRLINFIKGEGMEIILNPQEHLEQGEEYLGTFHAHPVTNVPSIHDVLTFLADPTEQISIVRGVSGYINLMIKKPQTRQLNLEQIEATEERYPKGPDGMVALVRDFEFLYYQGLDAALQRTYDIQQPPPTGTISLDELVMAIQGYNALPQPDQDIKKKPPAGTPEMVEQKSLGELPANTGYFWHKLGPEYTFNPNTRKWEKK